MPPITSPLKRGPWRYLSDRDVLHAAMVVVVVLTLSLGLVWLGYLIHVWRIAARSSPTLPRPMTVLVFGRRLVRDQPEADYQQRLERALALMRSNLTEHVLLLGGCSGGTHSEAAAGRAWLAARELPAGVTLRLEQASIDSLENLRHARSLLQEDGPLLRALPPVALVTSPAITSRAAYCWRAGWVSTPCPWPPNPPSASTAATWRGYLPSRAT